MVFDLNTFYTSSRRFAFLLKNRGIKLKRTSTFNVWSRALTGKNYNVVLEQLRTGQILEFDAWGDLEAFCERLVRELACHKRACDHELARELARHALEAQKP